MSFLYSSLVLLASAVGAPDSIREHQRGDIEIKTDLSEVALEDVFTLVETTQKAADELLERLDVRRKSSQSLKIRLYALAVDYEDFRRRTFDQRNDIHLMSFYNDQDRTIAAAWEGGTPRARGELRGQIGRQVLGNYSKNAPPWLREAFFGWFEALETDRYGDPVDLLNRERMRDVRQAIETGSYCPLFELMDLREPQFYGLAGAPNNSKWPRETLYSESWSVLFFLAQSPEPSDKDMLKAVGVRLDTGRWSQSGQQKSLDAMEPRWREFLRSDEAGRAGKLRRDAWAALDRGNPREARDLAAEAVALDKTNASAQRVLAHAGIDSGDYVAAIASFGVLRKLRPKDADAALGFARAYLLRAKDKGDPADFDAALEGALAAGTALAEKDKHEAYIVAAEICEARGEAKAALKWVREARRHKGLTFERDKQLTEWEERLVKAAIGK